MGSIKVSGDVRAAAPTPAERVLTVLATAGSLTLEADGLHCDVVGLHDLGDDGVLRLRTPVVSALAAHVVTAPMGELPVRLHFTDVAPAEVRDRVRARVVLTGWLAAYGAQPEAERLVLRFEAAEAVLETGGDAAGGAGDGGGAGGDGAGDGGRGDVAVVEPDELAAARPDPLAAGEAAMLLHLADAHREAVDALTRLVAPVALSGVVRVQPLALDRYGLTLRLEQPRTHLDVRLPFPAPVRDRAETGAAVQTLLAAAAACPRRARRRR